MQKYGESTGFFCPSALVCLLTLLLYCNKVFCYLQEVLFMTTIEIADELAFQRTLRRLAHQILENNPEPEKIILAGVLRRGVPLAEQLAEMMEQFGGVRPSVETLDITLYRDDLSELAEQPDVRPTHFSQPVAGKTVILVDDVIYTGRTARAAMDAVIHMGRPARIRLAVMVDRGHRELPIDPEYVGKKLVNDCERL